MTKIQPLLIWERDATVGPPLHPFVKPQLAPILGRGTFLCTCVQYIYRRCPSFSLSHLDPSIVTPWSLSMEQPRIPWEVIERVIDHSRDDAKALSSFSLACHQLRPRSLSVRFAQVEFKSRDHVLAFVDLLQDNPSLKPFIRSIVVQTSDWSSFPLLHMLPHLFKIVFRQPSPPYSDAKSHPPPAMYRCSLTYFLRFGIHIRSLHLCGLFFETALPFVRLLLAFPNMVHLTCAEVTIEILWDREQRGQRECLELLQRRLSEQMRLKTLTISSLSPAVLPFGSVGELLSGSGSVLSTVKTVRVMTAERGFPFMVGSKWSQLQRLELHFRFRNYNPPGRHLIPGTIKLLEMFRGPMLKEVVVEVDQIMNVQDIFEDLGRGESGPRVYDELERGLLGFPQATLTWNVRGPLRLGENSFWTRELRRQFPVMSRRGAVTLKSSPGNRARHSGFIDALAVSPDSNWVASGFDEPTSTIILWDMEGRVVEQWVAHRDGFIWCLAFSPDSRYLASGIEDGKIVIWDLSQGADNPVTLEGHAAKVSSCAWHPDGRVIASGSDDESVRLWDTHTQQQLCIFGNLSISVSRVTFSLDGRILAATGELGPYHVWDVASGALQASIPFDRRGDESYFPLPAFRPGSKRVAAGSGSRGTVEIWDAQTGTTQTNLALGDSSPYFRYISFSSDGKLLATMFLDGTVKIWDSHTGVQSCTLEGLGHDVGDRPGLHFSPCGMYVAFVARGGRSVGLWRTDDGSCVMTLPEHECPVYQIAFSPDGKTLLSGMEDGTVHFDRMHDIVITAKGREWDP